MTALPPEILRELQEEYLSSFNELLTVVKAAADKSDWKTMENHFHKFAGSGSTYGLPLVTEIARDLEHYLMKTGIPDPHIIQEMIKKFEMTIENYKNQMGFKKLG